MMTLKVNGQNHEIDADPDTPLLYVLADDIKLNAAKFGCGLGQWRFMHGDRGRQRRLACVTPLFCSKASRNDAGGSRHDRSARADSARLHGGAAAHAATASPHDDAGAGVAAEESQTTDEQIRAELEPHLCRCGTQMRILRAVHPPSGLMDTADAASATPGEHDERASYFSTAPCARGRGALIVSFSLSNALAQESERARSRRRKPPGSLKTSPFLDSWIRIDADGGITVFTGKANSARAQDRLSADRRRRA